MTRWERWSFNLLNGIVAASGLAYLYMKVVLRSDDPFAVVNHPWQPSMLALHVVAAPFFMLIFGVVLRSHVLRKLTARCPSNRRSGWISLVGFGVMALSGYLLQVVASPLWLDRLIVVHVGSSTAFLVGYAAHLVIGWRLSRSDRPAPTDGTVLDDPAFSP